MNIPSMHKLKSTVANSMMEDAMKAVRLLKSRKQKIKESLSRCYQRSKET